MSRPPSKFAPYRAALESLSTRTKTPLPSLVVSFAILHEITAVVPLVSVFFFARSFGIGEQAVTFVRREISEDTKHRWLRDKSAEWIEEGERWAARVGKRYGVFGYPKVPKGSVVEERHDGGPMVSNHLAGDVANAVLAYGVTKAMLPARIGLSIYLAPMFSRRFVEPIRSRIVGSWRRST